MGDSRRSERRSRSVTAGEIVILVACGVGIACLALAGFIRRRSLRPRHALTERDLSRLRPVGAHPPTPSEHADPESEVERAAHR